MKKYFLLSILSLCFAFNAISQTSGNFVSATVKPGSTSSSVYVAITSNTTLTNSEFSTFQFALAIPASVTPISTASVTSANPAITYAPVQVSSETQNSTLFNVYSFSGDGAQTGTGITYTAGVEYNLAEVFFSGGPSNALANLRIVQIPNGGIANGNDNFYAEDRGFDVTNQAAQFYSSTPANVSNDGNGYTGSSYAIITSGVLPIKLTNFSAIRKDNDAVLNWQVANQDATSSHFDVERGFTGTDFKSIGRVDVNLNSGATATYSFNDVNIAAAKSNGLIFYRLKMVDKDGKFTYSPVKSVRLTSKGFGVNLYPNPAKGFSNLSIELSNPSQIVLSITDAAGRIVQNIEFTGFKGLNQKRIDLSKLAGGSYMIKVNNGSEVQSVSLIKE